MSTTRDWLPTTREGILAMADDWISVCPTRQTGWNIPAPALTELTTLRGIAAALAAAVIHRRPYRPGRSLRRYAASVASNAYQDPYIGH